jgi:hypothetical protein
MLNIRQSATKTIIAILKIGACLCVFIGFYAGCFLLGRVSSFDEDYYIVGKQVKQVAGWTEYAIQAKHPDYYGRLTDFVLDASYSKSFYETAVRGDRLRTSHWYSQLIRNGRVVKRDFSGECIFIGILAVSAFLPLVVFVRFKGTPAKALAGFCVGLTEFLVIGLLANWTYYYYTD